MKDLMFHNKANNSDSKHGKPLIGLQYYNSKRI